MILFFFVYLQRIKKKFNMAKKCNYPNSRSVSVVMTGEDYHNMLVACKHLLSEYERLAFTFSSYYDDVDSLRNTLAKLQEI